jgi:hypothetical protein
MTLCTRVLLARLCSRSRGSDPPASSSAPGRPGGRRGRGPWARSTAARRTRSTATAAAQPTKGSPPSTTATATPGEGHADRGGPVGISPASAGLANCSTVVTSAAEADRAATWSTTTGPADLGGPAGRPAAPAGPDQHEPSAWSTSRPASLPTGGCLSGATRIRCHPDRKRRRSASVIFSAWRPRMITYGCSSGSRNLSR